MTGSCAAGRVAAGWWPPPACARAAWRVLLVTGTAAPGDIVGTCGYPRHWPGCEQMLEVMRRIVGTMRPIGDAVPPPGAPPTMVLLGKGGSGAAAWEAGIEQNIGPIQGRDGSAGFMVRFPQATPTPSFHWEPVERCQSRYAGVVTQRDCLSWLPGSGLLLSGLAREEVASVRIELAGRAPVEVATFGRD